MKILHITESYGGGVKSAIGSYAQNTDQYEHYLLASNRRGSTPESPATATTPSSCTSEGSEADRAGSTTEQSPEQPALFRKTYTLPLGHYTAIKAIYKLVDELRPDIVHLHSSFAGFYGRFRALKYKEGCSKCPGGVKIYRPKIVYTPHCYAFQRLDISRIDRAVFWIVEKVLASRADVYACCSTNEVRLTKTLRKRANAIFVPNVSDTTSRGPVSDDDRIPERDSSDIPTSTPDNALAYAAGHARPSVSDDAPRTPCHSNAQTLGSTERKAPTQGTPAQVVSLGRITPQKNFALFEEVAQLMRASNNADDNALNLVDAQQDVLSANVDFTWIGDGDAQQDCSGSNDPLPDAPPSDEQGGKTVNVTGWLEPAQVGRHLQTADVYLHTALWEGFPVAILDAINARLPVIALERDYLDGFPKQWLFRTAPEAIALIDQLLSDAIAREDNLSQWQNVTSQNVPQIQAKRLQEVYK